MMATKSGRRMAIGRNYSWAALGSESMQRPFLSVVVNCVFVLALVCVAATAQRPQEIPRSTNIRFTDVTTQLGLHFRHMASPTKQKYLLEPVAPGVALFDCDNDGRLDIFFVNSARLLDPMPPNAVPEKTGPEYWSRLYHQKPDGTFEDISERAGVAGRGYQIGVAVGDYDNDGYEDLFVTGYPNNALYHND